MRIEVRHRVWGWEASRIAALAAWLILGGAEGGCGQNAHVLGPSDTIGDGPSFREGTPPGGRTQPPPPLANGGGGGGGGGEGGGGWTPIPPSKLPYTPPSPPPCKSLVPVRVVPVRAGEGFAHGMVLGLQGLERETLSGSEGAWLRLDPLELEGGDPEPRRVRLTRVFRSATIAARVGEESLDWAWAFPEPGAAMGTLPESGSGAVLELERGDFEDGGCK